MYDEKCMLSLHCPSAYCTVTVFSPPSPFAAFLHLALPIPTPRQPSPKQFSYPPIFPPFIPLPVRSSIVDAANHSQAINRPSTSRPPGLSSNRQPGRERCFWGKSLVFGSSRERVVPSCCCGRWAADRGSFAEGLSCVQLKLWKVSSIWRRLNWKF